jgi:hypothetical protein
MNNFITKTVVDSIDALNEELGYTLVKPYYPVPIRHKVAHYADKTVFTYQRIHGIGQDEGLLVDLINASYLRDSSSLNGVMNWLTSLYKGAIHLTARRLPMWEIQNKLYGARSAAGGRLDQYYGRLAPERKLAACRFPVDLANATVAVNGVDYPIQWMDFIRRLRSHFQPTNKTRWAFVSQGDPTELNISAQRYVIDFDSSGYCAIAGEIACFIWGIYLAGGYLVPLYRPSALVEHEATIECIRFNSPSVYTVEWHSLSRRLVVNYQYRVHPIREMIIRRYCLEVVGTLPGTIWREVKQSIKYYLIMRMLGTINICRMSDEDMALMIAMVIECEYGTHFREVMHGCL